MQRAPLRQSKEGKGETMDVHLEIEPFGCRTLADDGCSTCGDVAVPVKVIEVRGNDAVVEDRLGVTSTVAIDFVPEALPGDILLVHMGMALAKGLEVRLSHEVR